MSTVKTNEIDIVNREYLCENEGTRKLSEEHHVLLFGIKALIVGKHGVAYSAFKSATKKNCPMAKLFLDEINNYYKLQTKKELKKESDQVEKMQLKIMMNNLIKNKKWSEVKLSEMMQLPISHIREILEC